MPWTSHHGMREELAVHMPMVCTLMHITFLNLLLVTAGVLSISAQDSLMRMAICLGDPPDMRSSFIYTRNWYRAEH